MLSVGLDLRTRIEVLLVSCRLAVLYPVGTISENGLIFSFVEVGLIGVCFGSMVRYFS